MVSFAKRTVSKKATPGKDFLIYINTGESEANPTWTLIGGQRSGTLNRSAESRDASHKTSGGWKSTVAGLREWSIDLESVYLIGDDAITYLDAAFAAGEEIQLKFEYPDKSYITGWGTITSYPISTPHSDVATISGTISGDGPLSELKQAAE